MNALLINLKSTKKFNVVRECGKVGTRYLYKVFLANSEKRKKVICQSSIQKEPKSIIMVPKQIDGFYKSHKQLTIFIVTRANHKELVNRLILRMIFILDSSTLSTISE